MALFVYLDESGDTGFRFRQGSSRYFIVTLLLVDDPIPIHTAVEELRVSLGFVPGNEFKFNKASRDVRDSFFRMLGRQRWSARILVIDKTLMRQPPTKARANFYHFVIQLVLQNEAGVIEDATLILDESMQSKKSKQRLATYLRQELNTSQESPKVSTIRFHASHTDHLIQATDMVSGAVYAKYHRGNAKYFDLNTV